MRNSFSLSLSCLCLVESFCFIRISKSGVLLVVSTRFDFSNDLIWLRSSMTSEQGSFTLSAGNLSWKSNETSNDLENLPSTTLTQQIFVVLFPCMVFIGVVCNSLIFVIMRRRRMSHLSTCYYMGILAIADTSVLLLGLSVMWLYLLNRQWSLLLKSTYVCKFLALLFYTVSDVSVWLVCMMSADRCIAVTRPLHASSICTVRRARVCACILVLCILLINVQFLFTHHLSSENECTYHENYEFFSRHIWPWIDAAVYSVLPFILLLTMNLIIVHALFQARHSTTNLQIYQSQEVRRKSKLSLSMSRKLTTMLLAVTFFFLLSSFPMVCLQIYINIHQKNSYHQVFTQLYLKPLCETLQYSNHCVSESMHLLLARC